MPLQNRVTPFGEIVAISQRGMLTGNRGIIHDPATRTLLPRRWTTRAWITCVCEFRGRRRPVMARRSWTELFFLDEATALAAGHRPCFYCRRADANRFREAWMRGNDQIAPPRAPEMDAVLHRERLDAARNKRLHPLPMPMQALPDGTMLTSDRQSYLVLDTTLLLWTAAGYRPAPRSPIGARLLTPPSTVNALAAGYHPLLHPTAHHPAIASSHPVSP